MDCVLGQILLFPFTYAPYGWLRCDGTVLAVNQNTALFSLLGIAFGGDGRNNFFLPKLTSANPLPLTNHMDYFIATQGEYPKRP